MGIDFGMARIGIALSDPTRTIASPAEVLHEKDKGAQIKRVVAYAIAHQVSTLVVGIPFEPDGRVGPMAEMAEKFAAKLATVSGLPVVRWDERFTSAAAEQAMRGPQLEKDRGRRQGRGARKKKRPLKGHIDKVAAALILQEWLDAGQPGADQGKA